MNHSSSQYSCVHSCVHNARSEVLGGRNHRRAAAACARVLPSALRRLCSIDRKPTRGPAVETPPPPPPPPLDSAPAGGKARPGGAAIESLGLGSQAAAGGDGGVPQRGSQ